MRRPKNVFDDLGFSPEEASILHAKTALHSKIVRQARRYTQAELQRILGEPQPRISDLMRGKITKFSLETLFEYAQALHLRPEIKTHAPVATRKTA